MDSLINEDDRTAAIDQFRRDILTRTSLTFIPQRHDHFMNRYSDLPGESRMSMRNRIKLISDDYERKFLRRVETVVQHSTQAGSDHFSEFNWEADAWRDIFGRLRDDERLRMDKREYNYKATALNHLQNENNEAGKLIYMGKRIPDITFGLSSYESGDPDDEGVDERERRIRRCLQKSHLSHNAYKTDEFSLICDPKWNQHTLLFPFAVYEAKRDQKSELQVKLQLKLAFNAYLHMLGSLVRQPGKEEYQSQESRTFPIFGFTSSGSQWRMYVGYLPNCVHDDTDAADDPLCDNDSHMKLIWWGDTHSRQHAGELLDMVDQIHEYAVTTHRPFVARHLGVWHSAIEHRIHQYMMTGDPDLANLRRDERPGWYSIKKNGMAVRKSLRKQHEKGVALTDDDLKRSMIEARLNEAERSRQNKVGPPRRRGRPRKVQKRQ